MKVIKKGYILVAALLILAISTIIVTGLAYRTSASIPFFKSIIDRQKASLLARAGIAHIQGLLTFIPDLENKNESEKKENDKKKQEHQEIKTVLLRIMPLLNKWNEFFLQEAIDGVDGSIKVYVSCENGKINLNNAYDFDKKKFFADNAPVENNQIDNSKKLIMAGCSLLEKKYHVSNLFEKLEKFLKDFDGPLNDISDLLLVPDFEILNNYIFPNFFLEDKKQLFLADIFTIFGDTSKLNPWFFAEGIKQLCGIKEQDIEKDKKLAELINQFVPQIVDWQATWQKIGVAKYQKNISQLPKGLITLFDPQCVPKFFMVVSVGHVNMVSHSLVAFLEVIESRENNRISYESRIIRWYVIE